MTHISPNFRLRPQPFEVGERVRPHRNFKHYHPDITECTVVEIKQGHCETGWLVGVKEFDNGKCEYDSSWFFKIH